MITFESLHIQHQETEVGTNCYLLFDQTSRESAIIDVGGVIDELIETLSKESLHLKYFLFTHGHFDHVIGFPALREKFPNVPVCLSIKDYEDMQVQKEWIFENMPTEFIEEMQAIPKYRDMLEFDAATFPVPDIQIDETTVFNIGQYEIKSIHVPGHSPGSYAFHVGNLLFGGDALFQSSVGRTDVQNSSPQDLVHSVQRLYELLPDGTRVLPGHGPFTNIGTEKHHNEAISLTKQSILNIE